MDQARQANAVSRELVLEFLRERRFDERISTEAFLRTRPSAPVDLAPLLEEAIRWSEGEVTARLEEWEARGKGSRSEPAIVDRRYRVVRALGEGGFGRVLLVEDLLSKGEMLALKIVHGNLLKEAHFEQRFRNEIRVLRALAHPRIPRIYNDGKAEDGALYYTMSFVEGETLDARLQRDERLPAAEMVRLALEIVDLLAYAHAQGVVHRDLKPANVMLVRERDELEHVRLLDFGIAKVLAHGDWLQRVETLHTAQPIGTWAYMPPEQLRGENVDARSDVYALGMVLYRALVGRLPGSERGPMAATLERMERAPRIPSEVAVPPEVRALVESLLAPARDRRPMLDQVAARLAHLSGTSPPSRRRRALAWAGAALFVIVAGLATVWLGSQESPGQQGSAAPVLRPNPEPDPPVASLPARLDEGASADTLRAAGAATRSSESTAGNAGEHAVAPGATTDPDRILSELSTADATRGDRSTPHTALGAPSFASTPVARPTAAREPEPHAEEVGAAHRLGVVADSNPAATESSATLEADAHVDLSGSETPPPVVDPRSNADTNAVGVTASPAATLPATDPVPEKGLESARNDAGSKATASNEGPPKAGVDVVTPAESSPTTSGTQDAASSDPRSARPDEVPARTPHVVATETKARSSTDAAALGPFVDVARGSIAIVGLDRRPRRWRLPEGARIVQQVEDDRFDILLVATANETVEMALVSDVSASGRARAPFLVDRDEVTLERYLRWCGRTAEEARNEDLCKPFDGIRAAEQSVVGVRWSDAEKFAGWAGKALPYKDEWMLAATRGAPPGAKVRADELERLPELLVPTPLNAPVELGFMRTDVSRFGVHGMSVGAREWCADADLPLQRLTCGGTSYKELLPGTDTRSAAWRALRAESLAGEQQEPKRLRQDARGYEVRTIGLRCVLRLQQEE